MSSLTADFITIIIGRSVRYDEAAVEKWLHTRMAASVARSTGDLPGGLQ